LGSQQRHLNYDGRAGRASHARTFAGEVASMPAEADIAAISAAAEASLPTATATAATDTGAAAAVGRHTYVEGSQENLIVKK